MPFRHFLAALVLTYTSAGIQAVEFECSLNGDKRKIRLEYPGKDHLCEVSVTKADNERTVQWYADNDSSFCSEKIYELVDKYIDEWNFNCQTWPGHEGLENLSERHRAILDNTVKSVTREGTNADIPFIVAGAQAHTANLTDNNKTAIVVQLFIETNDDKITSDRTYFFVDDGDHFSTTAVFAGLKQNIELLDKSYRIDSAVVSAVHPSGEIEVNTTLNATDSATGDAAKCFGSQFFKPNLEGTLDPVNQHQYECNL